MVLKSTLRCLAVFCLLLLSGCQEFQGPVWSPDGQTVAFTLYARAAENPANAGVGPSFSTSVYTVGADDDPLSAKLLADGAAFPNFTPDEMLYCLGERSAEGFYTKLLRWKLAHLDEKPEVAVQNLRATALQMSMDRGPVFMIFSGRNAQPGAPGKVELWHADSNKRTDLGALGTINGPALSYNSRLLCYGTRPADGHAVLMLSVLDSKDPPQAIFPTNEAPEPNVSSFVVHAFPESERFLFYGPGASFIWMTQGKPAAMKFSKIVPPQGLATPVMARIAADGRSCAFTFARITTGKIAYESHDYDFNRAVWNKIEADSAVMIGGTSFDPKAKKTAASRRAWLSQAGLAVGEPNKPLVAPITANQFAAAASQMLKAGDNEKALEFATKSQDVKPPPDDPEAATNVLIRAYLATKNAERACDAYEQSVLLAPVGPSGLHFLFPNNSALPQQQPEWIAGELHRMDELIAASRDNRMIPVLKEAFLARLKGDQRKAVELYQRAYDLCPDKARTGGTKFFQGMCELEQGNAYQAGEFFDSAAHNDDFPQADYAAGLAALSFMLHGRTETTAKANQVLALPSVQKSPLAAEFGQLSGMVKNRQVKEHGSTKETVSADGAARAWAEFDTYWLPFAATKPVAAESPDGKLVARHVTLKRFAASTIWTNKSNTAVFKIAAPVTQPQLSPSGNLLAFTASGDVFPLPDNFCELFVLNLDGAVHLGNTANAVTGKTKGRQIISKFAWETDSSVKIQGVEVDVFGGQRTLDKSVAIARAAPKPKAE